MSRTIRYLTVTLCLFLLLGIKTRGSQEVEVDAFANPSPYTVGDTIEIDVDSFWEDPPSQCDGDDCELESIDIEISGDDGFEDSSGGSSEASFFDSQVPVSWISLNVSKSKYVTVTSTSYETSLPVEAP